MCGTTRAPPMGRRWRLRNHPPLYSGRTRRIRMRPRFVGTIRWPDAHLCLRSPEESRASPTRSGARRRGDLRTARAEVLFVGRASPLASGDDRPTKHSRTRGAPGEVRTAGGIRRATRGATPDCDDNRQAACRPRRSVISAVRGPARHWTTACGSSAGLFDLLEHDRLVGDTQD